MIIFTRCEQCSYLSQLGFEYANTQGENGWQGLYFWRTATAAANSFPSTNWTVVERDCLSIGYTKDYSGHQNVKLAYLNKRGELKYVTVSGRRWEAVVQWKVASTRRTR